MFFGCEDVIEIEVPSSESKLIIDAIFEVYHNQTPVTANTVVKLRESTDYYDDEIPVITNAATVLLKDLTNDIDIIFEDNNSDGNFVPITQFIPIENVDYELNIFYNEDHYKSQSKLITTTGFSEVYQGDNTLFTGEEIEVLEDNKKLSKRMDEYDLVEKTFFKIPNQEGLELNAWMMKPKVLDTVKKHPLLMFVYGGPGNNTVNNSWSWMNYFWFQYLVKQGFVVISVDNRGTGYRGRDFKHSTYLQLGKLETEDQISAAIHMGKLNYIDKDRIGIFGWSYGGYMSSLCITKGAKVFNSAIAVAPVTNWRYYDNIYTERFMRTPKENGLNYDINSPINHVDKLKGNYMLIHGTADDNVHFQNSMEMVNSLVKENKEFDFFAYPNKNHSIYGGYTRLHLYNKMTNFLFDNLLND